MGRVTLYVPKACTVRILDFGDFEPQENQRFKRTVAAVFWSTQMVHNPVPRQISNVSSPHPYAGATYAPD